MRCALAVRALFLLPLLLLPSRVLAEAIDFGRYYGLVIGANDYRHLPKLETAVNDASAMHDLLTREYGYESQLLLNPTRTALVRALDQQLAKLTEKDNLLIFYAGHGHLERTTQRGYWLPVDAEEDSRANWLSVATITDTLQALAAKHVLVIADSCFSGTLTRNAPVLLKSGSKREAELKRISGKRARKALTSGGLEPVVDGGGDGHSVFTRALLESLRGNTDVLDGYQLYRSLRRTIVLNAEQTPEYSDIRLVGDEGGDFLFVPVAARVAAAPPAPAAPNQSAPSASPSNQQSMEALFWQSIKDSRQPADFQAYLRRYPNGVFAALARNRLGVLERPKTLAAQRPQASPQPARAEVALDPVEETFVLTRNANVRAAPTIEAAKVTTLPAGTEVYVPGETEDGEWLLVELGGKRLGFIYADLLEEKQEWQPAQARPRHPRQAGREVPVASAAGAVVVNGVALRPDTIAALSQRYGSIPPGNYWYDRYSGFWGMIGGPSIAQIEPGLAIGGPLAANASGGRTGVFVNGRELHSQEYLFLQSIYGVVIPGRYWMNAQLIGGFEGGPPSFDLGAAARGAAGGYGGGGGYNRNTIGGGLMSDGECSGYLHPGGATVMTGNC